MKELIKYKSNMDLLDPTQIKAMIEKTPKEYIKERKGRGNMTFSYVETGYVIKRLNEIFNYMWSFEVVEEKIMKEAKQVAVRGKLTVHPSPEFSISKTQYGGSVIKVNKEGKVISIADDFKSASSDCLKKCASLLGIASDVYWGKDKDLEDSPEDDSDVDAFDDNKLTKPQMAKIFAMYKDKEMPQDEIRAELYTKFAVTSHKDMTKEQGIEWIDYLEKKK